MFWCLLLVSFIYFYQHCISFVSGSQDCQITSQQNLGKCIPISNCPSLYNLLKEKTQENLNYVSQLHCGFDRSERRRAVPKVCCPLGNSDERLLIENTQGQISISNKNQNTNILVSPLLPSGDICGKQAVNRVFGGTETDLKEFPWMALLEYESTNGKSFRCGGMLINNRYVLTAAHCLTDKIPNSNLKLVSVRFGEHNINEEIDCLDKTPGLEYCSDKPIDIKIEEQIRHEDYDPNSKNYTHDIALLRLSKEVHYTDFIKPICLPKDGSTWLTRRTNTTVSGWGITENERRSAVKLKVELPIVPESECSLVYQRANVVLGKGHICIGGIEGKGACQGDSGGPVMLTDEQTPTGNYVAIGIVSFGLGCGKYPEVNTRISSYSQWILDHIKK